MTAAHNRSTGLSPPVVAADDEAVIFLIGVAALALFGSVRTVAELTAPAPAAPVASVVHERAADAEAMLRDVNARRKARGLAPLRLDAQLCAIARAHALDMAARAYLGHDTPEGESPFERLDAAHYRYGYAGENLALDRNVDAAARALWYSPEHRENILEPHYVRVGIAAVSSPDGEIFVEDFSD